jgi:hypothetical protein
MPVARWRFSLGKPGLRSTFDRAGRPAYVGRAGLPASCLARLRGRTAARHRGEAQLRRQGPTPMAIARRTRAARIASPRTSAIAAERATATQRRYRCLRGTPRRSFWHKPRWSILQPPARAPLATLCWRRNVITIASDTSSCGSWNKGKCWTCGVPGLRRWYGRRTQPYCRSPLSP